MRRTRPILVVLPLHTDLLSPSCDHRSTFLDDLFNDDTVAVDQLGKKAETGATAKKKKKRKRNTISEGKQEPKPAAAASPSVIVVDGTGASQYDGATATTSSRRRFMSSKIAQGRDWEVKEEEKAYT